MASTSVLDPITDTNRSQLVSLSRRYDFPDFVKQADLDATTNPGNIAITAYADPVNKKFPCHTAAATWLSACYYMDKAAEYHTKTQQRIEERFNAFAKYFGIEPQYSNLAKQAKEIQANNQLPDSSYAFVWESEDGHKERYYPMTNAMETKVAAEWLHKDRDKIPFASRHVISKKILQKAAQYGTKIEADVFEFLEKQAGQGIPDPADVYRMLKQRATLAKTAEQRETVEKLAEVVKSTPRVALQTSELTKLAATVDLYDHTIGLKGKYTDIIKRPEDVIIKTTFTKSASESSRLCQLQTGNSYNKEQLGKLAREDLVSLFGDDFAKEVCTGFDIDPEKMAAVAHTLPRHDAELLEQLLQESGQQPRMSKAASLSGFDSATLEALAKAYA